MATASSVAFSATDHRHSLSVIRLLVTGGFTAAIVFLLCWLGTFIPFASPTHAYIGLFTSADYSSERALVEGFCWSLLFGGLVGAVFALIYNAIGRFGRE